MHRNDCHTCVYRGMAHFQYPCNYCKRTEDHVAHEDMEEPMQTIKDSGTRREFSSGAVRDTADGKGSMVSVSGAALLRMAKVLEGGANNYGRFNYMKGMPLADTMDSLGRHYAKYQDGWDDEDHLAMVAVNAMMAMETEDKHPELIDHPLRIGKSTFNYKENAAR